MSAAPSDPPPASPPPPPAARPERSPAARVPLTLAGAALIGWFAWLSYAALTKSHEPIVSRAQAAIASMPVVATVEDDKGAPAATVTIEEALSNDGPPAKTTVVVENLPAAHGFVGKGKYLLLLPKQPHGLVDGRPLYHIVSPQGTGADPKIPTIYPWSPDVEAQARRLFRTKE